MHPSEHLVAVVLLSSRQDYQLEQEAAARRAAAEAGLSIEVAFADNSPFVQIKQFFEYINRPPGARPAAIVAELAGLPAAFSRVARAALTSHIGWVELTSDLPREGSLARQLHAEHPDEIVASVAIDEKAIGRIHAEQCRTLLPRGGNILYLEGPGLSAAVRARRSALEEGLQGSGISIAKTLVADWTEHGSERVSVEWLDRHSTNSCAPSLVCSQNDAMAMGLRRVAVARHLAWARAPLLGCDGLPDGGQRYVRRGIMTATVVKPITSSFGVRLVSQALRREAIPTATVLEPMSFPGSENLSEARHALA